MATTPLSDELADRAAPLDALLVDAALGPLRRLVPDASTVKFAAGLVRRPCTTGRRLRGLAAEVIRIGAGTSTVGPSKRDRRFTDPAWSENPLLRRVVQVYLASRQTAERLVLDTELGSRDEQRVRFMVENLVEALSPSNVPLLNPASAKAAIDTAGLNSCGADSVWCGTWPLRRAYRGWWTPRRSTLDGTSPRLGARWCCGPS